ncbi:hypothetical protein BZA70DRAFT_284230 [Myxozyma melibiosi]|uniref:Uncharacterized protein n=1 Tax=Myxozyma melibiosi TaxID=54550 RepID=A0ABR1EZ65_9ASCO
MTSSPRVSILAPVALPASVLSYALSMVNRSGKSASSPSSATATPSPSVSSPISNDTLALVELPFAADSKARYAKNGHNLLSLALSEADPELSRQLYIHALTYLLRALPDDLARVEALELSLSLPDSLSDSSTTVLPPSADCQTSNSTDESSTKVEEAIVHIVRALTSCLCLSLPIVVELLRRMADKEREYKFTEKCFAVGSSAIDRLSSSPLGVRVLNLGIGVIGAAGRGVVEGLTVVKAKNRFY